MVGYKLDVMHIWYVYLAYLAYDLGYYAYY